MTQSNEDIMKKWAPILESAGVTGSKADWMSKYVNQHGIMSNVNIPMGSTPTQSISESMDFPLLPVAMKVAAKTIGMGLVTVKPMSGPGGTSQEEMDRIKAEIKAENREGKIDSILEGKEFKEKDITEHPDYKGPGSSLFYLDFKYGGSTSSSDTDTGNKTIDKLK